MKHNKFQPGDLICKTYMDDSKTYLMLKKFENNLVFVYFSLWVYANGRNGPPFKNSAFDKQFLMSEKVEILSRIKK